LGGVAHIQSNFLQSERFPKGLTGLSGASEAEKPVRIMEKSVSALEHALVIYKSACAKLDVGKYFENLLLSILSISFLATYCYFYSCLKNLNSYKIQDICVSKINVFLMHYLE